MSRPDCDVCVIGAGVVGLACAAALARAGRDVWLLERRDGICRETSSRNSEVVHAGLYYPAGSLKALACVRGRDLLYARCERLGIPAVRTGKLVVAVERDEVATLEAMLLRARACGVTGLEIVDSAGIARLEPGTAGVAALWSPDSGIVDSHRFAASLRAEAERGGATVAFKSAVQAIDVEPWGYSLRVGDATVGCSAVVNAAGLGQAEVSSMVGIDDHPLRPVKGTWFSISARHRDRVRRLVYPTRRPGDVGLGVHLCIDVGGGLRLGPDTEDVDGPPFDLTPDESKRSTFFAAGRRILPWLEERDLQPDMAGVRATPTGDVRDFVIEEEAARGLPGWVTLAGIESPGLTAALAIAERVSALLAA